MLLKISTLNAKPNTLYLKKGAFISTFTPLIIDNLGSRPKIEYHNSIDFQTDWSLGEVAGYWHTSIVAPLTIYQLLKCESLWITLLKQHSPSTKFLFTPISSVAKVYIAALQVGGLHFLPILNPFPAGLHT